MSTKLNRLLRGVIKEFRDQLVENVEDGQDITPSAVKTMLCYKCDEFPKDEMGLPLSFTKITNKEASSFLEWIFREGGQRGYTFGVIEDEWSRIIKSIRI
jgi:hypothetical protein